MKLSDYGFSVLFQRGLAAIRGKYVDVMIGPTTKFRDLSPTYCFSTIAYNDHYIAEILHETNVIYQIICNSEMKSYSFNEDDLVLNKLLMALQEITLKERISWSAIRLIKSINERASYEIK